MPARPRISVVVPLYQKAATVARALSSIVWQTRAPDEIVVVDDGSTDGGLAVAASFPDARIRLVRQPNAGPGAARNRGARECGGEYLAFLDADDAWDARYLERVASRLDAGPALAAASCSYATERGDLLALWRRRGLQDGAFRAAPSTAAALLVSTVAFMSPCTSVVRRVAFERHGGFYERDGCRYGEDAFFFLRLLLNEPVSLVLESLVRVDAASSALNRRSSARPIEPLFAAAAELRATTPPALQPLLRDVLALRAAKTACVAALWGRHAEARALVADFTALRDLRYPWVLAARLCATRLGPFAAGAARRALAAR